MTTFPLPSLVAQVALDGITAPPYSDILESLKASYRSIYGSDAYLDPDSQDGQLIAIFAAAVKDTNDEAIAVYNAFSPATAQGRGLSSVIKVNGMRRKIPTNSTVDVTLVGQAGTEIINGVVQDVLGNRWNLPADVIIPPIGQIDVTAVADALGNIAAAPGTITQIVTATRGWQSVTNSSSAVPGAPLETDAALRRRQSITTSQPAQSTLDGMIGALANLPGVEALRGYENWSDRTDQNGIPGHSIAIVIQGGDDGAIANIIATRKTPGTGTFGTTSELVIDPEGVPLTVHWFRPTLVPLQAAVTLKALNKYVSTTGNAIAQAIADYVNASGIGNTIYFTKLFTPANLDNSPLSSTYDLTALGASRQPFTPAPSDIVLAFFELPTLDPADVTITVT